MLSSERQLLSRMGAAFRDGAETLLVQAANTAGGPFAGAAAKTGLQFMAHGDPARSPTESDLGHIDRPLQQHLRMQFANSIPNIAYTDFRKSLSRRMELLSSKWATSPLPWFDELDGKVVANAVHDYSTSRNMREYIARTHQIVDRVNAKLERLRTTLHASCCPVVPRDAAVLMRLYQDRGLLIELDCKAMTSAEMIDEAKETQWPDLMFVAACTSQVRADERSQKYSALLGLGYSPQSVLAPKWRPRLRRPVLPTMRNATGHVLLATKPELRGKFRIELCNSCHDMKEILRDKTTVCGANAWWPMADVLVNGTGGNKLREIAAVSMHDCCYCQTERFGTDGMAIMKDFREAFVRECVFLAHNQGTALDLLKGFPAFVRLYGRYKSMLTRQDAA